MRIEDIEAVLIECNKYENGEITKKELEKYYQSLDMLHTIPFYDLNFMVETVDIAYKKEIAFEDGRQIMDYHLFTELYNIFFYISAKLQIFIDEADMKVAYYDLLSRCGFIDFIINDNKNQYDLFVRISQKKYDINTVHIVSEAFADLAARKDMSKELQKLQKLLKDPELKDAIDLMKSRIV